MSTVIEHTRTVGIKESKEFQKKCLASHGLNVGLLCGHRCSYCSTAAMIFQNKVFTKIGMSSFEALQAGVAIVDPSTPLRAAKQAKRLKPEDVVMLSTMTDPYAPEAQAHGLGRACAAAVLENSQASLRVLTKNAAVADDLDYFAKFKGRVMLGLSLTAPVCKENVAKVLEPQASSITERIEVYRQAKKLGLRVYGMLCPLLPGVASSYTDIRELMETMLEFDPGDIWLEPVNPRGNGLVKSAEVLKDAGFKEEFYRVDAIRETEMHQLYVDDLVDDATKAARDLECLSKLKILVYGKAKDFCCDTSAVIWL